jgi:hypothetical protein
MANSRDFTGKNRKFTGTKGIVTPKGTTGQRVGSESGELRFNTTTELMEYYDGNQWKPIDAPPSISSISTSDAQGTNNILNADGSTLHTITITGGNFGAGVTVKFIGDTGTEYVAGNTTRVSGSSITCKTTASMGTTDDPYDVQVTNTSGLSALLEDAFSFNAPPVFTVASGTLGSVYNGQVISGTTLNAGATDAEGNTITFTIISGSLPGSGLTISSSTGAITGTLAGTPSLGNYPFVVRAATTEGTVERQFSIQVVANPFLAATGGTVSTVGGYKYHTFTSGGSFIVSYAGTSPQNTVEYLAVAGGGGGGRGYGGGGGAGGAIDSSGTFAAATYTIVIGGGGTTPPTGTGAVGGNGVSSTISGTGISVTTTGGGGGGFYNLTGGVSGGSGGGGGGSNDITNSAGTGTSGQGSAGGTGTGNNSAPTPIWGGGGGGGGKTAVGVNGVVGTGGNGGAGINWKSLGTSYAGGGGGGVGSSGGGAVVTGGTGGAGGGGNGAQNTTTGTAGAINTGGGGGGAGGNGNGATSNGGDSGTGGSGIVILRYQVS